MTITMNGNLWDVCPICNHDLAFIAYHADNNSGTKRCQMGHYEYSWIGYDAMVTIDDIQFEWKESTDISPMLNAIKEAAQEWDGVNWIKEGF